MNAIVIEHVKVSELPEREERPESMIEIPRQELELIRRWVQIDEVIVAEADEAVVVR